VRVSNEIQESERTEREREVQDFFTRGKERERKKPVFEEEATTSFCLPGYPLNGHHDKVVNVHLGATLFLEVVQIGTQLRVALQKLFQ
jgi:hypothetical protein